MYENYPRGVGRGRNFFVSAGRAWLRRKCRSRFGLRLDLDLGSQGAGCDHAAIGRDGIASHLSGEIGSPPLGLAGVGIRPVEAGLGVAVLPFHRTVVHLKKNVAAVIAPMDVLFDGFVVCDLTRRLIR